MYTKSTAIYLSDTDATGVIFYPKLLEKCLYVYENFLIDIGKDLKELFGENYFFPVVGIQVDFIHPLKLSDKVSVELSLEKIGKTSVSLSYKFFKEENELAAKSIITHVLVDQKSFHKVSIPQDLKDFYQQHLA